MDLHTLFFFKDDTFSLNTGDFFQRTKTVINKDGFIQRIQRTTDFVVWAYRDVIIRLYALRFIWYIYIYTVYTYVYIYICIWYIYILFICRLCRSSMICTYDYIYMVICHWNWGIIPRIQSDNHSVLARVTFTMAFCVWKHVEFME